MIIGELFIMHQICLVNRNPNKNIHSKQLKWVFYCPILTRTSENCTSDQTEIVTGDPLFQQNYTL